MRLLKLYHQRAAEQIEREFEENQLKADQMDDDEFLKFMSEEMRKAQESSNINQIPDF